MNHYDTNNFFLYFFLVLSSTHLAVVICNSNSGSYWKKEKAYFLAGRVARNWAQGLLWLGGIKVCVHGKIEVPPGKSVLVVSNHQGAFDIPIFLACLGRSVGFIAKKELQRIPSIGLWMRFIGCVFIVREDRRQSLEAIKTAISYLKNGISIIVFPEGTRSNQMLMRPFKKGSLSIAVRAGVPIIPVTIKGSFNVRKGDSGQIQPAAVELFIDPPIDPLQLTKEEQDNLPVTVENQIAEHLEIGEKRILI